MKKLNLIKLTASGIICFFYISINAQNNKLGSWNIANLTYHLDSKFALYGELQGRSQRFINDFYYHEIKGGVYYYLPQKHSFFIGFGNYETYIYPGTFKKPVTANEYRLWEQFTLNNTVSRIKIEQRYRIEQRWVNGDYFNRFRYRVNPVVLLNHNKITPNTVFISAFEEVFFTNKAPYFIRNRFFGGAGYEFTKLFTLQVGFIRQFDYRVSDNGSGKNFIQTSLLFNVDHTNSKREVHPSIMD